MQDNNVTFLRSRFNIHGSKHQPMRNMKYRMSRRMLLLPQQICRHHMKIRWHVILLWQPVCECSNKDVYIVVVEVDFGV